MAAPKKVSEVLSDLSKSPQIAPEAREAILAGLRLDKYTPSPQCPCERCHRVYRTIP